MGSKGSQSTNTVQNTAQTYNANPAIAGIGSQAISQAQAAGSQPFQMPVAPVAGFNADQQAAFQQYRNLPGMASPYLNQANQAYGNAATPIGAGDISQFYDPMASRITSNLKDVFGHQNVGTQGNLIQQAGGVGADRIAVGMGEAEKAQGSIANNAYLGAYQQALQAAQQQKQLQLGAGSGFTNLASGATQDQLAALNAYMQSGQMQQHQTQQELNAPYQNRLAQLAYPYQNAQFLAGITGGLAPAFGGTTYGNQNGRTTAPQPSMLSQLLGVGTAGAGLYGAFGGFSGSGKGSDAGTLNYGDLGGGTGGFTSGTYAEGGEVGEEDNPRIPGIASNEGLAPIPYLPLHGGAGHSSPLTGGVTFQQPQQEKPQDSGGGLGDILKTAASIAPFFLKDGGVAGYDEGGGDDSYYKMVHDYFYPPAAAKTAPANGPSFGDRFAGSGLPPAAPTIADAGNNRQLGTDKLIQGMTAPYRLNAPGVRPSGDEDKTPAAPAIPMNRETAPSQVIRGMMPQASQPYPDALARDTGQNLTRSPWMALVNAGATMAATPGPLGVSLGKGMLAGTKSLDDQRKELQSEQGINQKAQALYQTAKAELDKYNKMTPYEAASVQARNKEIDQSNVPGATKPLTSLDVSRAWNMLKDTPGFISLSDQAKQAAAIQLAQKIKGLGAAAPEAATPGSTAASPIPDPGESRRVKGMWYIGPSGKPQQWQ